MDTSPAPPEPLVSATGIEVSFGGLKALEHVDVAVYPGEAVTVIGPSGAGKSTLVRVLLGLLKADRGAVVRRPEDALRAALAEVGVPYALDRAVQALSGGELQRVLLARALLADPDLLILDEPLQSVDFAGQLALFELIGEVRRRRGCGVLMVSHDLHIVMAGTDRVLCLNRHVCCKGAPDSVSRHPEYIALFGPRAAEELAVYVHAHDHGHDVSGEVVPLAGHGGDDGTAQR